VYEQDDQSAGRVPQSVQKGQDRGYDHSYKRFPVQGNG
jgi:hypothetical protein